nr:transposase [Nonomuraea turkmeniaca]
MCGAPGPAQPGLRRLSGSQEAGRGAEEVYAACDSEAAEQALLEFADSPLGKKYPAAVAVWERAWDKFTPFLEFPPALRKVLYTTNAIESFNRQMRKVLKTRGHFPTMTQW